MLAHLIEVAQTQVVQGIEAFKPHHHQEEVADVVPSNSIAITQVSGQANFVLMPTGTYADPDPIKTANTEKFNVAGIWNIGEFFTRLAVFNFQYLIVLNSYVSKLFG